jgi:hypothetical protein
MKVCITTSIFDKFMTGYTPSIEEIEIMVRAWNVTVPWIKLIAIILFGFYFMLLIHRYWWVFEYTYVNDKK